MDGQLILEIVNKISESESTGSVKDIENVNLGQKAVISSLSAHHGTSHGDSSTGASLDLSLYPEQPEDNSDDKRQG